VLLVAASVALLAGPGVAAAHPRVATVAIDYRLPLDASVGRLAGVRASVLDGDRALRVTVDRGLQVVILGDLGEPMLRIGNSTWVNRASPTAQAARLVRPGTGWQRIAGGGVFAWHDHRLSPPPFVAGRYGPVGRWAVPVELNGARMAISGSFWRVPRPRWWVWASSGLLAGAASGLLLWLRPRVRPVVTVASAGLAGAAALTAEAAFALRDSPSGRVAWVPIAVSLVVASVAAWLIASGHGARRAYVAGTIGAGVAALSLSWLGVFFHGAVIAALPASAIRLACAATFTAGLISLGGALATPPPAGTR
jgi:hypothetical protein